jgi:hypothetical protein
MSDKILQGRQLERRSRRPERGPAEVPRQQCNRADLDDKSTQAHRIEHTPPPKIDLHINVCELCAKKGV